MTNSEVIEMLEAEWRDRRKAAVLAEREACALICDEHADDPVYCGEAIRARGQA